MDIENNRPRIFVVEDEALIAMELNQRLIGFGYRPCGQAASGPVALTRILQTQPDLVLMDIRLQGEMSGIETAAQLRAHLDVPVIYITAFSDAGMIDKAVRTAPYGYLVKPFEEGALRANIEMALYKHSMERKLLEANHLLERRNQELVRERQRALDAELAKGDFLAMMSHEIRTPLNAILGMTDLLMDTPLNSEQTECASMIQTSGQALLTIVNDILDFSKIEANRFEFEITPFDLWTAVEEAAELLAPDAEKEGLELVVEWPAGLPRLVMGDAGRLRQILLNLIGNALKFTERGHVRVKVESAPRVGTTVVRNFHLSVEDTGCGIAADKLPRLFEKYRQADSSVARKFGGSGLGLAICKKLVEGMGGTIRAESRLGAGSSFHVVLPLEIVPGEREAANGEPSCAGRRVLLASQRPLARRLLSASASALGLEVVVAADLSEASSALASAGILNRAFDLAVFDSEYCQEANDGIWRALLQGQQSVPPLIFLGTNRDKRLLESMGLAHPFTLLRYPLSPAKTRLTLTTAAGSPASLASARRAPEPVQKPDPDRYRDLRVLVVEDNLVNQRVAARFLERLGCQADVASGGIEALQMVRRNPYNAIFMDLQMPDMSGHETTIHIRSLIGPVSDTPIIAMTASAFPGDREACLASGMNDYISKPVDPKLLPALLDNWAKPVSKSVKDQFNPALIFRPEEK